MIRLKTSVLFFKKKVLSGSGAFGAEKLISDGRSRFIEPLCNSDK